MRRPETASRPSSLPLQRPEALNPYQEVMRYVGQGGTDIAESLSGGITITEHRPDGDIVSVVGEIDENLPVKQSEGVSFSSLSENAQKLYYQLKKEGRIP
ncbi:MAG: hypothetical protein WAV51_00415 [Microgenomates group bacterium]